MALKATPASGFGTIVLNAAETQIVVNESWTNLTANAANRLQQEFSVSFANPPVALPEGLGV